MRLAHRPTRKVPIGFRPAERVCAPGHASGRLSSCCYLVGCYTLARSASRAPPGRFRSDVQRVDVALQLACADERASAVADDGKPPAFHFVIGFGGFHPGEGDSLREGNKVVDGRHRFRLRCGRANGNGLRRLMKRATLSLKEAKYQEIVAFGPFVDLL